jgi:transposase
MLLYLPPYSPELNPKENLWDEIREKIFIAPGKVQEGRMTVI